MQKLGLVLGVRTGHAVGAQFAGQHDRAVKHRHKIRRPGQQLGPQGHGESQLDGVTGFPLALIGHIGPKG